MITRKLGILVSLSALIATSSQAAFKLSYVVSPSLGTFTPPSGGTPGPATPATSARLFAIDVYALNQGGETGTGISALDMSGSGLATLWKTNASGVADAVNGGYSGVRGSNLRSYLTAVDVTQSDSTFLYESFEPTQQDPLTSWGNAGVGINRLGAINPFHIAGTAIAPVADATLSSGLGLQVAHLVVATPTYSSGGTVTIDTSIAGSSGPAFSTTQSVVIEPVIFDPDMVTVSVMPTTLTIDVSPDGLESASATITAVAGSSIASIVRNGAAGVLADNLSESGTNPRTLSLSNLTYADVGTYTFTYVATSGSGSTGTGTLTINIVPEPALLTSVCIGVATLRRRRR